MPTPKLNPDPNPDIDENGNASATPDPFAIDGLRLSQAFIEQAGVKKLRTTVPVRKPNKQDFIRVHPDERYRFDALMILLKEEGEHYLVRPELAAELVSETTMFTLYTAVNRAGVVFIWPVRLPAPDGKQNEWWRSAREIAEYAMKNWVRVQSNMSLGAYEMVEARKMKAEPLWPEESMQDLLRIAFRGRLIDRLDHAVLKHLRGES
jgi:hypothetical protein